MGFRVKTTAKAKQDLDAILGWLLSQGAGEAGLRWFRGLQDDIRVPVTLRVAAYSAPENDVFPFEVRQLRYGKRPHVYRILFTVEDDTVTILHIRDGRRLPPSGL